MFHEPALELKKVLSQGLFCEVPYPIVLAALLFPLRDPIQGPSALYSLDAADQLVDGDADSLTTRSVDVVIGLDFRTAVSDDVACINSSINVEQGRTNELQFLVDERSEVRPGTPIVGGESQV